MLAVAGEILHDGTDAVGVTLAEQGVFEPPFKPLQYQFQGPVPLKEDGDGVPELHRLVGAVVKVPPLDALQTPLIELLPVVKERKLPHPHPVAVPQTTCVELFLAQAL